MNRIQWMKPSDAIHNFTHLRFEFLAGLLLVVVAGILSGGANYLAWNDGLSAINFASMFMAGLLALGLLVWLVVQHMKLHRARLLNEAANRYLFGIVAAGLFTFWGVGTLVEDINTAQALSSPTYSADAKRLGAIDAELTEIRDRLNQNAELRANTRMDWRTGQNTLSRTQASDGDLMARQKALESERSSLRARMTPAESGQVLAVSGTIGRALSWLPVGFVLFLLTALFSVVIEGLLGAGCWAIAPAVIKLRAGSVPPGGGRREASIPRRENGQVTPISAAEVVRKNGQGNGQVMNTAKAAPAVHSGQPRVSENGQAPMVDSGKNGQGRGGGNGQRRRRKSGQSKEMRHRVLDGYIGEYPDASLNEMCDAAGVSSRETVRKDLHEMGYSWNSDRGRWISKRAAVA